MRSITPGSPKSPATVAVIQFIGNVIPIIAPKKLSANYIIPPSKIFTTSFIKSLNGHENIFAIITTATMHATNIKYSISFPPMYFILKYIFLYILLQHLYYYEL